MQKVDIEKLATKFSEVANYEEYYKLYGEPLVLEAVGELDSKVNDIKAYQQRTRDLDLEFDSNSMQRIVIDLSSCIYYTTDKLEKLQLLADVSKLAYKNSYNTAYITKQGSHDAGTKFSVQQLQAYSENEALEDNLINFIYTRATNEVENKLDAAEELLKSCSKVLSALIAEANNFGRTVKYQM